MIPAIILAGGLGTRLRGAVPDLPKPMAPLNGRPFLEHQLDYWIAQGVDRFVLSVGYKHEVIQRHFGNAYRGARVDYAIEMQPLGTGGGLLLALEQLQDAPAALVLNGDTFFEVQLSALVAAHEKQRADITLSLFMVDSNSRYTGVETDREGRITALAAAPTHSRQLINGGVYVMQPSAIAAMPFAPGAKVSLETDMLTHALEHHMRIYGHTAAGRFIDIGIPEDYQRAAGMLV